MARGSRQSITFSVPQLKWVKREAKQLGLSVSDFVRRLVDDARAEGAARKPCYPKEEAHDDR